MFHNVELSGCSLLTRLNASIRVSLAYDTDGQLHFRLAVNNALKCDETLRTSGHLVDTVGSSSSTHRTR